MKQWELSGVTVDLTDRALSADGLREAEQRLSVLIQRIPAVIWTVDRDLRFTSSLGSALIHLGLKPNEVVGKTLFQFFQTEDPQFRAIAAHLRALGGEADTYELQWAGRTWHSHVEPFPGPDGLPAAIGVALDITDRKEAEDRLRETGARYHALVDHIPAITYVEAADEARSPIFVSPQVEAVLGYSAAEWKAGPGLRAGLVFPEDRRRLASATASAAAADRPFEAEYRMRARDGRTVWIHDEAVLLRDLSDRPSVWQGVMVDVSEQKGAEEALQRGYAQLRQADEERRQLLARLVRAQEDERRQIASDIHDDTIQTMASVAMRLDLAARKHPELRRDTHYVELSDAVRGAIQRLRHLVFELRPDVLTSGGLAAALDLYLEDRRNRDDGIEYRLENRLPDEPSDEVGAVLYRIAQEALTNARVHARASHVVVELDAAEAGFRLRVIDDGVGFETTARPSEFGHLGLTAMRERAEMAGGWCRARSAPGDGATVECWLPAATA
jgi:PAS domain S-box-containing protein